MSRFFSEKYKNLIPYTPGEQPKILNLIKLNTNENPYPPAPGVEKLLQEFDWDALRLYPDTDATVLVKELSAHYQVKPSNIFVGVNRCGRNIRNVRAAALIYP